MSRNLDAARHSRNRSGARTFLSAATWSDKRPCESVRAVERSGVAADRNVRAPANVRIPPRCRQAASLGPRGAGLLALALVAMLGGGLVLFWFDPSRYGFYPYCIFHRTTGLLCPGCGSLRALHQLLQGHLAAACHCNALLVLSLPLLGWFGLRVALAKFRGLPASLTLRPAWLWCALLLLVVFGVLRNLPFASLAWLAP